MMEGLNWTGLLLGARDGFLGSKGWRSGESARLPPMWPRPVSNPGVDTICRLSLLLVLSLAPRGFFSEYSGFPLSSKTNISKFQFDQDSGK